MELVKSCGRALLVGGLLGALGQLFFVVLGLALGFDSPLVGPGTLIMMGVFALITFPLGLYQKITAFGGFGAMFVFSGLAAAVAESYETAQHETGSSLKGVGQGVLTFLKVIGVGMIFCIAIALFVYIFL